MNNGLNIYAIVAKQRKPINGLRSFQHWKKQIFAMLEAGI